MVQKYCPAINRLPGGVGSQGWHVTQAENQCCLLYRDSSHIILSFYSHWIKMLYIPT